jgi:hypothetical protein
MVNCLDCTTALFPSGLNEITFSNPWDTYPLVNSVSVVHPEFDFNNTSNWIEIARLGNKFWTKNRPQYTQGTTGVGDIIKEFEIGPSCTITHVRSIELPDIIDGNMGSQGYGMCATNQYGSNGDVVLLLSGVRFSIPYIQSSPNLTPFLGEYTTAFCHLPPLGSSTQAHLIPLNVPHGTPVGDIIYNPLDNTVVTIGERWVPAVNEEWYLKHYSLSGTLLGSVQIPSNILASGGGYVQWAAANSLFSYGKDVYFRGNVGDTGTNDPAPVYKFDLSNYTIIPTGLYAPNSFDAASDPDCFAPGPLPYMGTTSWDCVQIGNHPKFGYKCVEIQGTSGQYLTKQECLMNGNCVELYPDPGMPGLGGGFNPVTGGTGGNTGSGNGGGEIYSPPPPPPLKPPTISEGEKG